MLVNMMMVFDFEKLHNDFISIIKGKGCPVGIKFLKKKDELTKLGVKPLENNRALCQVLKLAGVYEKTRGVYFDNIDACVIGTYIMGFGLLPEDIKERWVKGFNYTPKRFDELTAGIEALPQGKYEAAVFAPLKEYKHLGITPDSIVMFVNSAQSYLLMVGYFDATGKKPVSSINGHAACEVITTVIMNKSPWLTIPCGGARSIADAQDDEVWIGMKPSELRDSLERLKSIGFKYPAPVNQVIMDDLNPDHPLTNLITRKGKK